MVLPGIIALDVICIAREVSMSDFHAPINPVHPDFVASKPRNRGYPQSERGELQ